MDTFGYLWFRFATSALLRRLAGCAWCASLAGRLLRIAPDGTATMRDFPGDAGAPREPRGTLVEGHDGRLYGVSLRGGDHDLGSLYSVEPASGRMALHHSFGEAIDTLGMLPQSSLLLSSQGLLYGSTRHGGPYAAGVVFTIDRGFDGPIPTRTRAPGVRQPGVPTMTPTPRLRASLRRGGAACLAAAGLALALPAPAAAGQCASSCLLGQRHPSWRIGGSADGFVGPGLELSLNNGVDTLALQGPGAFRFQRRVPDGQSYSVRVTRHPVGRHCTLSQDSGLALDHVSDLQVHCTAGRMAVMRPPEQGEGADAGPVGPLRMDHLQYLYGLAATGGQHGYGALIRIAPSGERRVLHSFAVAREVEQTYRLAFAPDGQHLYGVTQRGGEHDGGVIFRVRRDGADYQAVHSFGGPGAGAVPSSPLLRASDGRYYGVTATGGERGGGTLYRYDPEAGHELLHAFVGADAQGGDAPADPDVDVEDPQRPLRFPTGELAEGADGTLYGAAAFGGASGRGGVFAFGLQSGQLGTLVSLPAGTMPPLSGLTRTRDGSLYGLTTSDPQSRSTLLRVSPQGQLTRYVLDPAQIGIREPRGVLVEGGDGVLYGTSSGGGSRDIGTVFAVNPEQAQVTVMYSFGGPGWQALGVAPEHGLLLASNGDLYGSTRRAGHHDQGAVFRIH